MESGIEWSTCDDGGVTPITFAHRGARIECPENTVEAFGTALAHGASGLESDAWLSADGEVVLVHDDTVGRALRRRKVRSSTAAELAAYGVPRLADVYERFGTGFDFSIDAKHLEVIEPMLQVAEQYGAQERLWLCYGDLGTLASLRPRTDARLVHSRRKERIEGQLERHARQMQLLEIDAMNFHHTDWTAGLVALFHRFEVRAFAWDVQEVRHIRAMLRYGIDGLYCDRPDRLVATVSEWST